jgi:hypothetical protein
MKRTIQYDWETLLNFGKYKGQSCKEVFQKDTQYISWCFQMIDWFCITDEIFEKLPVVIALRENTHENWLQIFIDKHNEKKVMITNSYPRTNEVDYYEKESYGQYAGNYAQDIEGLSDDFINDVLDGNPDAYWNID